MDLITLSVISLFMCLIIVFFYGGSGSECKLKFSCQHANGIQNACSPVFSEHCECGQTYLP